MVTQEGFLFGFDEGACAQCDGRCCRGESGYIWVDRAQIERMADFVNLSTEKFATLYLKRVGHRYSLREIALAKDDYACIFFDHEKQTCTVYEVRPRQCRTFPFWELFRKNFNEVKQECPGIFDLQ